MRSCNYKVRTHGHCRHRLADKSITYKSWRNMCARVDNLRREDYAHVSLCERWSSFDAFLADMGERPSPDHSIDRIDPSGDYEPGNCRWATRAQQARNKRTTRLIEHPETGEAMCLSDWAKRIGVRKSTLHWRLERWPLMRALSPKLGGTP